MNSKLLLISLVTGIVLTFSVSAQDESSSLRSFKKPLVKVKSGTSLPDSGIDKQVPRAPKDITNKLPRAPKDITNKLPRDPKDFTNKLPRDSKNKRHFNKNKLNKFSKKHRKISRKSFKNRRKFKKGFEKKRKMIVPLGQKNNKGSSVKRSSGGNSSNHKK